MYIYTITRLASNEIFSPSNKIHRDVGRAKNLSALLYILFIIIIGGILILFIYITRLASNEIFSPSNKIHREVCRAKDLSAPLYIYIQVGNKSLVQFLLFEMLTDQPDGQQQPTHTCDCFTSTCRITTNGGPQHTVCVTNTWGKN